MSGSGCRERIKQSSWLRPAVQAWTHFAWSTGAIRRFRDSNPPLNGQQRRRECLDAVVRAFEPDEIVETGTFLGSTSKYLARRYRLPVHTIELNGYFFLYSKLRLLAVPRVHGHLGTSMRLLERRARAGGADRPTLFYLDAHWYDANPLRDEVRFILERWRNAVLVVDDVRIDDDAGYGYDRDRGDPVSLAYLRLPRDRLDHAFYPAAASQEETGSPMGCVFVALGPKAQAALSALVPRHLRPAVPRRSGGRAERPPSGRNAARPASELPAG